MKNTGIIAAVLSAILPSLASAGDMRFHEAVSQLAVIAQVEDLIEGQPPWVEFTVRKGGPETPAVVFPMSDQTWTYYRTCRMGECNAKSIGLMLGADGTAYLRVTQNGETSILGNPAPEIEAVIDAQQ